MTNQLFLKLDQYFTSGMTPFQMRNFVINDFITAYRKLRQLVVEIKARVENKISIMFEIEELQIKIDRLNKIKPSDIFQSRLEDVERRRYEWQLRQKQTLITQIDFELTTFANVLNTLVEEQGGLDTLLTNLQSDEFHEKEESQYWIEKMASSAYSDFINYGTISKGVIDTIKLLPQESQHIVIEKALEKQYNTIAELNVYKDRLLVSKD